MPNSGRLPAFNDDDDDDELSTQYENVRSKNNLQSTIFRIQNKAEKQSIKQSIKELIIYFVNVDLCAPAQSLGTYHFV